MKKRKKTGDKAFYFYLLIVLGVSLLPILRVWQEDEEDDAGADGENPKREGAADGEKSEETAGAAAGEKSEETAEAADGEKAEETAGAADREKSEEAADTADRERAERKDQGGTERYGKPHTNRAKPIGRALYLILVLGICLTPLAAMGVSGQQEKAENRTLASMPEFSVEEGIPWEYLSQMGAYFDDHFAFRPELVSLDAWIRTKVFGISPVSDVIAGEDGWLYYTATLDDFQHKNPASDRMLFNIAHNVSLMQRYTESLGMEFLFTVAPNKNSLYGEAMPQRFCFSVGAQSDMDRLLFWLDREQINYVDLFGLFREQEEVLYYQRDSHWNRKGAVMVYNALLDACGKAHETYENSRTQITEDYYGDLNRMLFPTGGEPEPDIIYAGGNEWTYHVGETVEDSLIITESAEGNQTLLMYRDSFGNSLLPLLAGEYSQAVFSKIVPYPMTDLATYWPDVVIMEKVERHLPTLAEVPPLMSAPEAVLDGVRIPVESNTTLGVSKEGSYWKVSGTADAAYMSVDGRIFVEITDADGTKMYDAFCLSLSDDGENDYGYTIYLSEIAVAGNRLAVKVITERDQEFLVLKEEEISLTNE
ncbi:MAG: hypothetical protein NC254_12140 [bacterium]|nr:hypothetical protein [bacterium]